MKALIVDDERIIRMGIRQVVPWSSLGITEVFMAASGKAALEIFNKESIDIIITDIQMTEMTGIELIGEIRKLREDIRIIVLTGYDEFDYARECLRMRVQEFLLKPVDEALLIDTIKKQIQVIKEQKLKEEEHSHVQRITGLSEQLCLESWMRELIIEGNANKEEISYNICRKYNYKINAKMRIAILLPAISTSESLSVLTIKNLIIGFLDAQKLGITFEDTKGRITIAFFVGEKSDDLENCVDTLTKLIKDECSVKIRIVMGSPVEGFENVAFSYNDSIYLWNEEKDECKTLITRKDEKGQLDMYREVYAELKNSINANIGNTAKVLRIFDSFCIATNSYNITDQYVRRCCFDIASSVYFSYVIESGENADVKLNALLASLLSADREYNYEFTKTFLENLLEVEEDDAHELVTKVKRYINEHLTDDISVAGIASHFYLSPNYFSRLFKRITEEGCNEYIVRKRIEKAKYLLSTTNIKIGKIAQDIGYRDTNYFSLAFKKHSGMSPIQYRENIRQNR